MVADNGKSFDFEKTKMNLVFFLLQVKLASFLEEELGLKLMETLMDVVRVLLYSGVKVFMTKYLSGGRIDHDTTISNYEAY